MGLSGANVYSDISSRGTKLTVDPVDLAIDIVLTVNGLAIAFYFLRHQKPFLALGSGLSLAFGGIVLIVYGYGLISVFTLWILLGTLVTASLASFYAMTNRSREARLFLLWFIVAIAVLPLLQISFHFSMYILYASWLALIGIIVYFEKLHKHILGANGTN